jgi:hypothetical protein
MKKLLKTDSYIFGIAYAIIIPVILFGLIYFFKETDMVMKMFSNPRVPYLIALVPNLIVMRFLFVTYQMFKTGKGMLAITFIEFVVVFIYFR